MTKQRLLREDELVFAFSPSWENMDHIYLNNFLPDLIHTFDAVFLQCTIESLKSDDPLVFLVRLDKDRIQETFEDLSSKYELRRLDRLVGLDKWSTFKRNDLPPKDETFTLVKNELGKIGWTDYADSLLAVARNESATETPSVSRYWVTTRTWSLSQRTLFLTKHPSAPVWATDEVQLNSDPSAFWLPTVLTNPPFFPLSTQ